MRRHGFYNHLAYQTDGFGTVLATFTYDDQGVPTSVVLGSDPVNGPRYYYVYNGHGDVVALTDATGTVVASYSYDAFGALTASSESFPNNTAGWTNPYRYDGRDGVRYDSETGLYWLSVRAYDPALGRFLQHDPLGRAPFMWADQPYVYASNNPLLNVDPGGERYFAGGGGDIIHEVHAAHRPAEHPHRRNLHRPLMYWPRFGPDGGGGGGGGKGSGRGSTKEGVPPDALWQHSSERYDYTLYLGKAETDTASDYHYNFHVGPYNGGTERHNYHLTVPTNNPEDPLEWDWTIKDVGKGRRVLGDTLVIETWGVNPLYVAEQAMNAFFGRVVEDATTNPAGQSELSAYLYPEPEHFARVGPIYNAFVDLALHD